MSPAAALALACSEQARQEILGGEGLDAWRGLVRLLPPEQGEAEVALITRDVWGPSTDAQLAPHTRAFFEALEGNPGLRWVHTYASGLDRPVYQRLMARGVRVTNTAGANADAVAQTALAGFLYFARPLHVARENQRKGEWRPVLHADVRALSQLSILIVGWGEIGQRVGRYLSALGASYGVLRQRAEPVPSARLTDTYAAFNTHVGQADWVFFTCPLSEQTRYLFNEQTLSRLDAGRPLSVVNVARGAVIDTPSLLRAHAAGLVRHAHLDVFEEEPLPAGHPLWQAEGILVSPHMAGASNGNRRRVLERFGEVLLEYRAGRQP